MTGDLHPISKIGVERDVIPNEATHAHRQAHDRRRHQTHEAFPNTLELRALARILFAIMTQSIRKLRAILISIDRVGLRRLGDHAL